MVFSTFLSFCGVKSRAIDDRFFYTVGGRDYAIMTGTSDYSLYNSSEIASTPYYYSDGYFMDDPSVYNKHLSSMSVVLASALGNAYSTNASQLLSKIGFEAITPNDTFVNGTSTTTSIGVIVGKKTLVDADGTPTGKTAIVIGVRGGGYGYEFNSNLVLGSSGEHKGFSDSAKIVVDFVDQYIIDNQLSSDKNAGNLCYWVTGHSRAGSVSNFTAKYLIDQQTSRNGCSVFCYAFAPSYAGVAENLVAANEKLYQGIHNIVYQNDLVTWVTPSTYQCIRYGVDYEISNLVGTERFKQLLAMEAPGYTYCDDFHVAYFNMGVTEFLKLIFGELEIEDVIVAYDNQVSFSTYLKDFNNTVFSQWNPSRTKSYAEKTYSVSGFDSSSVTLQSILSYLIGVYSTMNSADFDAINNWTEELDTPIRQFAELNILTILN